MAVGAWNRLNRLGLLGNARGPPPPSSHHLAKPYSCPACCCCCCNLAFLHSEGSESDSEDGDSWAIQEGPRHQAVIPALRQLATSGPTPSEAKFLSAPVYSPPAEQQQQQNPGLALRPGQFLAAYRAAGTGAGAATGDGRRALIAEWVAQMDAQLGPELVQVRNALYKSVQGGSY
jgi:hypothetical protein